MGSKEANIFSLKFAALLRPYRGQSLDITQNLFKQPPFTQITGMLLRMKPTETGLTWEEIIATRLEQLRQSPESHSREVYEIISKTSYEIFDPESFVHSTYYFEGLKEKFTEDPFTDPLTAVLAAEYPAFSESMEHIITTALPLRLAYIQAFANPSQFPRIAAYTVVGRPIPNSNNLFGACPPTYLGWLYDNLSDPNVVKLMDDATYTQAVQASTGLMGLLQV